MPKASHLSKRGVRPKDPITGVRQRLRPVLLLGFGALVVFVATLAIIFSPNSNAQGNSSKDGSAFAKKADKMLHLVRKAYAHDVAQQRAGQAMRGKSRLEALSKTVGIHRKIDGTATVNIAVKLAREGAEELQAAGFRVGASLGEMLTLEVELARLDELASISSVDKISAAVRRYPANDRARQAIQIESFQGQRFVSQTGQGVVVAIIDTGIDFRHADFTIPGSGGHQTRIKALLDMTVYGSQSPDPGWNYILPGQSAFLTTDIINAIQFVQQKASELNKPFVINLSLGGQVGPHDGTAPDERAIDNLVNSGSGRAVCVAAGLIATAGVTLTSRQALIDALSPGTKTRAQVLREIVESSEVSQKYFNQAFVVLQYFGYLRRDPDVFYLDWIQVLNTTGETRGMISGFVNSLEYRFRFGP